MSSSDSDSSGDGMAAAMRKHAKEKESWARIEAAMKADAAEKAKPKPKDVIEVAPREAVHEHCSTEDFGPSNNWQQAGQLAWFGRSQRRLMYQSEIVEVIRKVGGKAIASGEAWTPVADGLNEWVCVGSLDPALLGKTYSAVTGSLPAWGDGKRPLAYRGLTMLLPAKTPVPPGAKLNPAAGATVAAPASSGAAKPAPATAPASAAKPTAAAGGAGSAAAAGGAGSASPAKGVVAASAPRAPAPASAPAAKPAAPAAAPASKPSAAPAAAAAAAGPQVLELGGTTTWTAGKEAATKQGKRLATQAEVQGYIKSKGGGKPLKAADEWVPVSDAETEWVSVGGQFPDRLGKTHTQVAGSKPGWGMEAGVEAWRGMVLMC